MTNDTSMKKIISLTLLLLVAIGTVFWFFKPYPEIDQRQVHPALRHLESSATCRWTSFGDGGSMHIEIRRRDGTIVTLCLSNGMDQPPHERGQLHLGASHYALPGATKITGFEHTKYVVAKLLKRDLPDYPYLREPIALLTGENPDWIMFLRENPSKAIELFRLHH